MFISVLPREQVEVVIAEEGKVNEYYVEMVHQAKTKGNIYKGYIHNIDNGLQAAFINYGAERNGFLQIDEVHPEYYTGNYATKKGVALSAHAESAQTRPGSTRSGRQGTHRKERRVPDILSVPARSQLRLHCWPQPDGLCPAKSKMKRNEHA